MGNGHTVESVKLPQLVRINHGLKLYNAAFAQCKGAGGVFVKFHRLMIQEKSDAVTCPGCAAHGVGAETHRLSKVRPPLQENV